MAEANRCKLKAGKRRDLSSRRRSGMVVMDGELPTIMSLSRHYRNKHPANHDRTTRYGLAPIPFKDRGYRYTCWGS